MNLVILLSMDWLPPCCREINCQILTMWTQGEKDWSALRRYFSLDSFPCCPHMHSSHLAQCNLYSLVFFIAVTLQEQCSHLNTTPEMISIVLYSQFHRLSHACPQTWKNTLTSKWCREGKGNVSLPFSTTHDFKANLPQDTDWLQRHFHSSRGHYYW